jgi:diketogulonate reductase-like aldo/keto reductase
VRAIGLSNLTPSKLDRLMSETETVPAVNEIQVHPSEGARYPDQQMAVVGR